MRRQTRLIRLPRTLRRRRPPVGASQQTLVLLPWLNLEERVRVGPMKLDRLLRVVPEMPVDVGHTAEAIARSFRDIRGNSVHVSMCWFEERGPTAALDEVEVDTVGDYILAAMIAAISENNYLSYRDQLNASHFQRVYQNFIPGTETVALVVRRRDGRTTSAGWQINELRFGAPAAVFHRPAARWKQSFLDAAASCVGAEDALPRRILDSAVWFFQGSELEEFERHSEDVVFLVSALEQLCGVSGGQQDTRIGDKVIETLGGAWSVEAKRTFRRWITEGYKKRSELHGGRAQASRWPYWGHALIATETYCLMTKALLAHVGRYALDDRDEVAIEALPSRIDCVALEDDDDAAAIAECWNAAGGEGAMRRATRQATEFLLRQLRAEEPDQDADG